MLESYKWDWDGYGMGWDGRKSLKGVILRAPLCGANKLIQQIHNEMKKWVILDFLQLLMKQIDPANP